MRHHGEGLVRLIFDDAVGAGADRLAGVFEPVGRLVEGPRADDAGAERNRVVSFDVVAVLADPTADDDFASPTNSTTTEVF